MNDYNKRRYTAENDNDKARHREFVQRQISLGNLEDKSSKKNSPQISTDDVRKDQEEETLKIDELDGVSKTDNNKLDAVTPVKSDDPPSETKSGKKKRRKKSILKKKNAQRKSSTIQDTPNIEVTESNNKELLKTESGTSSQDSTPSESEQ